MNKAILNHAIKTAWIMIAFTVVGTLSLAIIHHTTKAPISKAEAAVRMSLFGQILELEIVKLKVGTCVGWTLSGSKAISQIKPEPRTQTSKRWRLS